MKKKILISAYACEPGKGSEYGVGWNVVTKLADRNIKEIFVLTRGYCKEKIESEIKKLSLTDIHFIYYDIPRWLHFNEEKNWGEQINYIVWQLLVLRLVKQIHKQYKFSLFHHITFNQYRTPSPGFFLDIPFVVGPIGGAETISQSFDQDLDFHTKRKEKIRRSGKDRALFARLIRARKNEKLFLFSTNENLKRLSPYCNNYITKLVSAISFDPEDFVIFKESKPIQSKLFELMYAGRAEDWKGLRIFLTAIRKAYIENSITNFRIRLIGIRFKDEKRNIENWIEKFGLEKYVELVSFMQRDDLLKQLTCANLFVYPAFRDSGSMGVLEACVLGCPTICFDTGGQDVFPNDILIKIPVSGSYEENLDRLSQELIWAINNQAAVKIVGNRAQEYVYKHYTWESKVLEFDSIYDQLIK